MATPVSPVVKSQSGGLLNAADGELLPLAVAVRHVPPTTRSGKSIHPSTLWRWANVGVRGRKLRVVRLPSGAFTKIVWIEEFFASLNEGPTAAPPTDSRLSRELQAAGAI